MRGARGRLARDALALGIACALVAPHRLARADGSGTDSAAAQALFDQGKKLMAEGNYPDACPKLEESQRLDPGVGTLLNLADCYEQEGRTATAWSKFLEAASAAKAAGQADRESGARERAARLASRISKIVINVPGADRTPGIEIKRNGALVGSAQWGLAVPADQGVHTISASAPGRRPWETKVLLKGGGVTATVAVPDLPSGSANAPLVAAAPVVAPPADKPATDQPSTRGLGTQRALALVAGGVGVVGLGFGTVFGLQSKSRRDDADVYCTGGDCFDQKGVDLRSQALSAGNLATVGFVVGVAGLAGGAILWFTAKPSTAHAAGVGVGPGTVTLRGVW